jgi:protein gp37
MGKETGISWTDSTWNPIRGCSRVSEGCRNCYAESVAHRFSGPGLPYEGLVQLDAEGKSKGLWNGQIKFVEDHLLDPLKWKAPRRIFVNSMSDLFHENVTDEMCDRIFAVMALCPQHTFQVLTKRPERMKNYWLKDPNDRRARQLRWIHGTLSVDAYYRKLDARWQAGEAPEFDLGIIAQNVHLGVSVEDQKTADERIPLLLETPAAVRFISAEPLLGAIDLTRLQLGDVNPYAGHACELDALSMRINGERALGWAIVGGESGPGARPMHPDWARSLRDQCKAAGIPFFFKQWGGWMPWQPDGGFSEWKSQTGKLMDRHAFPDFKDGGVCQWTDASLYEGEDICVHQRVGTKAAGCLLDGVEHHEFPAVRS